MEDKLLELAMKAGIHKDMYYDNPEIDLFGVLVAQQCIDAVANADVREKQRTTYDQGVILFTKQKIMEKIHKNILGY